MNLDQLAAVNAVAQSGSFRAAAESLNRSPSALSELVRTLEDEFDIQIFDRSTYRASLTQAGEAFLKSAQSTLAAAQQTARLATELGTNQAETHLSVVIDQLAAPHFMDLIIRECAKPRVPVNLVVERSLFANSVEALLSGQIQLALAPCPSDASALEKIHLDAFKFVGVIDKALLAGRKISIELLSTLTQIRVYATHFQEDSGDFWAHATKREGSHKVFVPDHFTKVRLIKSGLGWGRMSEREFESAPNLVMIDNDVIEHVHFDMCLMRAKSQPIGITARAIWAAFENLR